MSIGGRSKGGVSERVEVTKPTGTGPTDARGAARMAFVNVPDMLNELDRRDGPLGGRRPRAEIGPYRKSRLR